MKIYFKRQDNVSFSQMFAKLSEVLKEKYGCEIIDGSTKIEHIPYELFGGDMLIHYENEDRYTLLSLSDYQSPMHRFFIERNNEKDQIFYSQMAGSTYYDNKNRKYNFKVNNFIYLPKTLLIDYDEYYNMRKEETEYLDKFIFRGNVMGRGRMTIPMFENNEYFTGYKGINIKDYYKELTNHKISLSVPGTGELCYRDIECMAIGIPILRYEFLTELNPKLIPNYHYISIDRIEPESMGSGLKFRTERKGGQDYYEGYIKRFMEVKDDDEFLSTISKNARKYYEDYLHPKSLINHVLNITKL